MAILDTLTSLVAKAVLRETSQQKSDTAVHESEGAGLDQAALVAGVPYKRGSGLGPVSLWEGGNLRPHRKSSQYGVGTSPYVRPPEVLGCRQELLRPEEVLRNTGSGRRATAFCASDRNCGSPPASNRTPCGRPYGLSGASLRGQRAGPGGFPLPGSYPRGHRGWGGSHWQGGGARYHSPHGADSGHRSLLHFFRRARGTAASALCGLPPSEAMLTLLALSRDCHTNQYIHDRHKNQIKSKH